MMAPAQTPGANMPGLAVRCRSQVGSRPQIAEAPGLTGTGYLIVRVFEDLEKCAAPKFLHFSVY